jgi:iron(III) transport system substrate-binding protein
MAHFTRILAFGAALAATPALAQDLTLYSGRGESLVAPLIAAFEKQSGLDVAVRYGGTAELAVLLLEEGDATPADLFWAQDAAALGAVVDRFAALPQAALDKVPAAYRDREGRWIASSGRARVIAYSKERASEDDIPGSIVDLTDERFKDRVGWAPSNGSFQAHVTAMRVALGEDETKAWLEGMIANGAKTFRNNTAQVQGIADGEIDFALPNNYYLLRFLAADAEFPVAQTRFGDDGDIGNLLMVAGVGVTKTADNPEAAQQFVDFLLSPQAQQYFAGQVFEYPVTEDVVLTDVTPAMDAVEASAPDFDLNDLDDLDGTLELLREVGLL